MQVSNKIGYQETAGEYVGSKSILGPHSDTCPYPYSIGSRVLMRWPMGPTL
jgi:hypothetical protein